MSLPRKIASRRRVCFLGADTRLPGVLMIGRYNHIRAEGGLHDHDHRDAVEICYLVKGRQTYRVQGRDYRLTGGDVFVTFPRERHGTGGLPQEKGVLYWMILRMPAGNRGFLGLRPAGSRVLKKALLTMPRRHFRGCWRIQWHLDEIMRLLHERPGALGDVALANHAVAVLLLVIKCSATPVRRPAAISLEPALRHIREHLGAQLRVAQLAEIAGLSAARFKARFKEELGIPPAEFVQRERVAEACRRLVSTADSITRIAFDLGYSSSQYFSTVFKRYTGKTPAGYRAKSAKNR